MATIRSYTTIEQSKVLAEILPIESADMHYNNVSIKGVNYVDEYRAELMEYNRAIKVLSKYTINPLFEVIPCWSIAALLELMPRIEHLKPFIDLSPKLDSEGVSIYYHWEDSPYIVKDNLIDACYEMIIKLHELKML